MWQPPRGAILVGVDGSAAALGAVRWAAYDAALRNVPLNWPGPCCRRPLTGVVRGRHAGRLQAMAGNSGHAISSSRRSRSPRRALASAVQCRSRTKVLYSATVPTLVGLSKEAAMVVVGYRGHGGVLVRTFLGSVNPALVYPRALPGRRDPRRRTAGLQGPTASGAGGHRRLAGVGSSDCDCIRRSVTTRSRCNGPARWG